LEHRHAGSLHAADEEMAMENARDVYTRRQEGVSIWVVESKHIVASNPSESGELFEPAADKVYRHPTFYDLPDELKHIWIVTSLEHYLLLLGDNSLILGHRLSELCGHGPNLETDIALTNHALDLYGQVRSFFQYAAQIEGGQATEDSIAFLRTERKYYNVHLVEQPNVDFAHVICRQFLWDAYHLPLMRALIKSGDETIAAIAAKSEKEASYHLRFSGEWMKRLGDGTAVSHEKAQHALNQLYRFSYELFNESAIEKEMKDKGIGADLSAIQKEWKKTTDDILSQATLTIPEDPPAAARGKEGIHSEHTGFILSELQYMQRAYPGMEW